MATAGHKSVFIPILLLNVGILLSLGIAIVFSPLASCRECLGVGRIWWQEVSVIGLDPPRCCDGEHLSKTMWECNSCAGDGRITVWRKWNEGRAANTQARDPDELVVFRKILENR